MKLGGEHILPMPPHLQRLPVTAYQGGLAKCVPMQKVCFNTNYFNQALCVTEFLTFGTLSTCI